jgi:hypothetical protein
VLNEVHACPSAQSVPACRRRPRPRPDLAGTHALSCMVLLYT